jgi:DNA-binding transcriptional MocR family regulator
MCKANGSLRVSDRLGDLVRTNSEAILAVTLPDDSVDDVAVADELRAAGVLVHPLSWHRRLPGPPGLVIGYAAHTPDRLREAAATISRVAQRGIRVAVSPPRTVR